MRRLHAGGRVLVGGGILALFALVAALGPLLVRDPSEPLGKPLSPPSGAFWLGTTGMGQDVLAQLVAGARPTLLLAFGIGLAVVAIGALVGVTAALVGGWLDDLLGLLTGIFLVVPGLPLVVVVGAYVGGGSATVALVLALTGWPWPARVLRALTATLVRRDFVTAAVGLGEARPRILVGELLPNLLPVLASSFVGAVVYALGAQVALEFLGIGDLDRVTWGTSLYWARNDVALLTGSWWTFVPAGLAVGLVGVALALLGGVFDEIANPRLRETRAHRRAVGRRNADTPTPVTAPRAGDGVAAPDAGEALLEVKDLAVDYLLDPGPRRVLAGVSFTLGRGEILGLCGESGSGKSTLGLALPRLLPAPAVISAGRVTLGGRALTALDAAELRAVRGRHLALVPQSGMNALDPVQTLGAQIADVLAAHPREAGGDAAAEADRWLALVGLGPDASRRYAHQLSGGMRQRAALAIALAGGASVVIMDEAMGGLDVVLQRQLCDWLRKLVDERGLGLVFISHDLPLTLTLADRVGILHEGRLVDLAPARELAARAQHPRTRALLDAFGPTPAPAPPAAPAGSEVVRAALVAAEDLHKTYTTGLLRRRRTHAVAGVSLVVDPGEVVALVGASGSGKTTLGRMLAGVTAPNAGRLTFRGVPAPARPDRRFRAQVQLIFQDPYAALNPARRVRHHVERALALHTALTPRARPEKVHALLTAVGLTPAADIAQRFPHELSGGQRQRVSLARALAVDPALIIADEPTSMLDASLRGELLDLLVRVTRGEGRGMLLITHDLAAARRIADRVLVMEHGRIVEAGPTATLLAAPTHPATAALLAALPAWPPLAR